MYVIIGATGNTGKGIALGLLNAGKKVRIISRSIEKSKELTDKGAELFLGNSDETELLKKAFKGAKTVYAVLPMAMQAENISTTRLKHVKAITEALKTSSVNYVVSLSNVGSELVSGTGIMLDLYKMEQSLNQIEGLNVLHLRPSFFMENTLLTIAMVKKMNVLPAVIKGDIPMPAIAVKDVSDYALKRLLALDFKEKSVQYLFGPRDVTYKEMAKIYGTSVGKPNLKYLNISYEELKQALFKKGISKSSADNVCKFFECINEGNIKVPQRNSENTQPTSIEEFAKNTYRHVYNMNP